jgi:hypothetical protein
MCGILMRATVRWFSKIKGSPTTRAGWHGYASGFFRWRVDMELLEPHPLRRVDAPRLDSVAGKAALNRVI